jgi:membrane-associated phospholipid phosphatase
VNRLRAELRRGVFGVGLKGAGFCIVVGVATYVASLGYDVLNHGPYRLFLRTPLDQALPVVPIFAVPYVSLQPVIYASLVIFLLFRARIQQSAGLSMTVTFLISYVFFAFVQTYVARPTLTGGDIFTQLVRGVYASDHPFNDFPSLHVSTSTIIAIHWWRFNRRAGLVAAIWVVLVAMSTVLIRQHYLADVAGGLILAFSTSLFFLRFIDHEPKGAQATPSSQAAA